jgi:hypothetical protein
MLPILNASLFKFVCLLEITFLGGAYNLAIGGGSSGPSTGNGLGNNPGGGTTPGGNGNGNGNGNPLGLHGRSDSEESDYDENRSPKKARVSSSLLARPSHPARPLHPIRPRVITDPLQRVPLASQLPSVTTRQGTGNLGVFPIAVQPVRPVVPVNLGVLPVAVQPVRPEVPGVFPAIMEPVRPGAPAPRFSQVFPRPGSPSGFLARPGSPSGFLARPIIPAPAIVPRVLPSPVVHPTGIQASSISPTIPQDLVQLPIAPQLNRVLPDQPRVMPGLGEFLKGPPGERPALVPGPSNFIPFNPALSMNVHPSIPGPRVNPPVPVGLNPLPQSTVLPDCVPKDPIALARLRSTIVGKFQQQFNEAPDNASRESKYEYSPFGYKFSPQAKLTANEKAYVVYAIKTTPYCGYIIKGEETGDPQIYYNNSRKRRIAFASPELADVFK